MPIKKENKSGGEKLIGYRTLFVNSSETQKLTYAYGLPPVKQLKKASEFQTTDPPTTVTDEMIKKSDLLRFNLGKLFFRQEKESANPERINYQFINKEINYNSTNPFDGLWDPAGDNKHLLNTNSWHAPIRYQIGFDKNYHHWQPSEEEAITYVQDVSSIEYGSDTFIILSLDAEASSGTYARLLVEDLKSAYPEQNNFHNIWATWLYYGKLQNSSPQYLGFGPMVVNPNASQELVDGAPMIYNDHAFVFTHPDNLNTQDNLGNLKVLYANIKAEYNFYQSKYEQALSFLRDSRVENIATELFLPNFNVILQECKNLTTEELVSINGVLAIDKEELDKNYLIHSTLNGKLPINILRPLGISDKKYEEVNGRSGNQYLDEWANEIINNTISTFEEVDLQAAANKFQNIIYPLDALKDNDINILKESFPFYNEIKFNTDTSNKMADILKNSKLFDVLVLDYIQQKNINGNRMKDIDFHSYQELRLSPHAAGSEGGLKDGKMMGDTSAAELSFEDQLLPLSLMGNKYTTYDFDAFAKLIKNLPNANTLMSSAQLAQPATISVSGEEHADDKINILENDPLTQLVYKMTFLSTYGAFIKDHLRTYKDIVEGKEAYNETLFYRIEKRNDIGEVIQNFYVLNDSELLDVSLIDTQIKYGTTYTYRIYAIQLVVGNEYFYKDGPPAAPFGMTLTNPYQIGTEHFYNVKAETKQSVKLIEIPYVSSREVKVQEAPPVPPNINFIPYRGVDNQLLITFNIGTGEYFDTYIPILPLDEEKIENSTIVNKNGHTLFKSEGDASSFELFRISERTMPEGPMSYKDFGIPNLAKRVTLSRDFGDPTYVDVILPNTKYWYTFRTNDKKHSVDDVGPDFSNPTSVFEVKLINNSGAVYLTVNTYDINFFKEQKLIIEKQKTKTMRKYLHLKPSFDQTIINTDSQDGFDYYEPSIMDSMENFLEETTGGGVSEFKLGYTEESVFGNLGSDTNNRFKIRLTSKKTGKKIDVFLRFKKPILEK